MTGGGRGLGRAMVLALIDAGANVTAAANIEGDFDSLKADCAAPDHLHCMTVDLREPDDCTRTVDETVTTFGAVHALVNNAALTLTYIAPDMYRRDDETKFWEASDEIVQNVMDVNYVAADRLARRVAPLFIAQGWGRIVNVTTSAESMRRPGFSPYGPSKAALETASDVWAQELAGTGVTVNILNPGFMANTEGLAAEARETFAADIVQPHLMAAPIVWLLSGRTNKITARRFDAMDWDSAADPDEEAARIGRPLGLRLKARD